MSDGRYLEPSDGPHFCRPPDECDRGQRWECECGWRFFAVSAFDAVKANIYTPTLMYLWKREPYREHRIRTEGATWWDAVVYWWLGRELPAGAPGGES